MGDRPSATRVSPFVALVPLCDLPTKAPYPRNAYQESVCNAGGACTAQWPGLCMDDVFSLRVL